MSYLGSEVKGFDRLDKASERFVGRLRNQGKARRRRWSSGEPETLRRWHKSTALRRLLGSVTDMQKGVFVDAGCGESPDADIALTMGFEKAYGIDLYRIESKPTSKFIKADICEPLPLKPKSIDVICSNWVMPCLSGADRELFYRNAKKLLKPGGYLSVAGDTLVVGYWHDPIGDDFYRARTEARRLSGVGFNIIHITENCVIAQKPVAKGEAERSHPKDSPT